MAAPVLESVVEAHQYAADVNFRLPRWSIGKMQNPVRGFLHGTTAVLGIVGTALLLVNAQTWPHRLGVLVFGLAIVGLYTTSSLYHSIPWRERWKKRMQRADRSMILVLIAGTYTPFAVIVLDAPLQWVALALAWGIAIAGTIQQAFFPKISGSVPVALATVLGWLSLLFVVPLIGRLGWLPIVLVGIGGVIYTIAPSYQVIDRIWIGTDDGLIFTTRDGGKSWSEVTPVAKGPRWHL